MKHATQLLKLIAAVSLSKHTVVACYLTARCAQFGDELLLQVWGSLMELYTVTGGADWDNSDGWGEEGSDYCTWFGTGCDHSNSISIL